MIRVKLSLKIAHKKNNSSLVKCVLYSKALNTKNTEQNKIVLLVWAGVKDQE